MGKKTKKHTKINGKLLQMNKEFRDLKAKQREKIIGWIYEEYKKYVTENEKIPDVYGDIEIVDAVLDKIKAANIWIPDYEMIII